MWATVCLCFNISLSLTAFIFYKLNKYLIISFEAYFPYSNSLYFCCWIYTNFFFVVAFVVVFRAFISLFFSKTQPCLLSVCSFTKSLGSTRLASTMSVSRLVSSRHFFDNSCAFVCVYVCGYVCMYMYSSSMVSTCWNSILVRMQALVLPTKRPTVQALLALVKSLSLAGRVSKCMCVYELGLEHLWSAWSLTVK